MLCVGTQGYSRRELPGSFMVVVNPAGSIPSLTQQGQRAAEAHLAQGATAGLYLTPLSLQREKTPRAPAWTQEHPGTAVTSLSHVTLLTHPHPLLHSACFPENQNSYPTQCQAMGIKKRGQIREVVHRVNQGIRNVGTSFCSCAGDSQG